MQELEIICPSSSPWTSLIVLANKSNGSYRFCVDYRKLNAVTRKDVFPLSRIEDLIDKLGGSSVFTCLDAASGYWQLGMFSESKAKAKTAFIPQSELYESEIMPFHLCNAPATFQRVMQTVLAGLEVSTGVYIDDIVIFRNLSMQISLI